MVMCFSLICVWVLEYKYREGSELELLVSWTESCLPHLYVEALNPNITVLGDRAYKKVIHVNKAVRMKPNLIELVSSLEEEETQKRSLFCVCTEERPCEDIVRRCCLQAGKRALPRNHLWWHFGHRLLSLQNCEKNKFLLFKPHSLWSVVMAAWENGYNQGWSFIRRMLQKMRRGMTVKVDWVRK